MLVKFRYLMNDIFNTLHLSDGIMHWFTQRISACSILVFVLLSFLFDNLSIFLFVFISLLFHITLGLRTLIDDYIHDEILYSISNMFLRISILFFIKVIFLLFIC